MALCKHVKARDKDGKCLICPPDLVSVKPIPADLTKISLTDATELLRQLDVDACLGSLAEFVQASWHVLEPSTPLDWNWHHTLLCNVLQGMFEDWVERKKRGPKFKQRARNVRCNQPPGSLKSRIFSVCFPVWCWLHDPTWSVICLSGNPAVALRDARSSRDLIESDWLQNTFKPDWVMRKGQDAIGNYATSKGGTRRSQQAGTKIVGMRADAIILDDPNDPYGSESEAIRTRVNETWNTGIANRLNNMSYGLRFIVQQRTHEEDLSGYTARQDNEPWLDVILPAEFETSRKCVTPWGSDPRTEEGESIHPERFTAEVIASEKKRFGMYQYAGQMQQRPAPLAGGVIKNSYWKVWSTSNLPLFKGRDAVRGSEILISVDLGVKGESEHDNSAFVVLGVSGANKYVLDVIAKPMYYPEQKQTLIDLRKKWPDARRVIIEDTANGSAVIEDLKPSVPGLIAFKIRGKDNETRIMSVIPEIEAGNVYLKAGAHWYVDFVDEANAFPKGRRDDRLVALAQVLIYLRESDAVRHARAVSSAWASIRNRPGVRIYR